PTRCTVSLPPHSTLSSFSFPPPAPTQLYTLSLHDALPISRSCPGRASTRAGRAQQHNRRPRDRRVRHDVHQRRHAGGQDRLQLLDRKSTRLNSSHRTISYAVFCLKKKKQTTITSTTMNGRN